MVTSSKNPNKKTYVHVNEIKYHTDDTIPIGNGSIFIPISDFDIKNAKKTYAKNKRHAESVNLFSFITVDFLVYPSFVKNTTIIHSNCTPSIFLLQIDRLKLVCVLFFLM